MLEVPVNPRKRVSKKERKDRMMNLLLWGCEEVVGGIESGICVESRLAGLYAGNEIVLGCLCGDGDAGGGEDVPEVDDLEALELCVHDGSG